MSICVGPLLRVEWGWWIYAYALLLVLRRLGKWRLLFNLRRSVRRAGRKSRRGVTAPATMPGGIAMSPSATARPKSNLLVWILCGIGGVILLGMLGTFAVGYWFVSNPGRVLGKILTAANPDIEVLNVDNAQRRITIRDKRDRKTVSLSFDDVKDGRISLSAADENGRVGRVELGSGAGKLPSWLPIYPGAQISGHLNGTGIDGGNESEGGMYTFSSADSPAQVMSFYQDKARELGMKVELTTATSEGGHISAVDEEDNRSMVVLVESGARGGASGSITFKRKR